MIRDEEIKRLVLYCKGLGIRINIKNYSWNDAGEWSHSPTFEININKRAHTSKSELILTMLHEISHHIYYVHNGKPPIPEAAYTERKLTKKERKLLYKYEAAGIAYMLTIWTELSLTLPKWKVEKAMEMDAWAYQLFFETGAYPTKQERKIKNNELNLKYKDNKK